MKNNIRIITLFTLFSCVLLFFLHNLWGFSKKPAETVVVFRDHPLPIQTCNMTARKMRILFVADISAYQTNMDRWWFQFYDAFKRIESIETVLWGPGWPEYNDKLLTQVNVKQKYGNENYFDFFFSNTEPKPRRKTPLFGGINNNCSTPIAKWYHECMRNELLPSSSREILFRCNHKGFHIIFHAYANNMVYYAHESYNRLLWHLPLPVNLKDFPQPTPNHTNRQIDVLLAGRIYEGMYPLRSKFLKLFEESKMPGKSLHLKHPGYWFGGSNSTSAAITQTRKYGETLASAKILLTCSSVRRLAVRKYIEGAAAGCLVIADIPSEREDEFRKWVVEVQPNATTESLQNTISWWLNHPVEREARAKLGQQIVLEKYTTDHAAMSALDALRRYQSGQRGMQFSHPFGPVNYWLPK